LLTRRQFLAGAATVLVTATGCRAKLKLPLPGEGKSEAGEPHPPLRVALLSDTHIQEAGMLAFAAVNGKLTRALADFRPYRPDFWLFNGDVTDDGRPGEFEAYRKIVAPVATPDKILATTGNHEFYDQDASDGEALRRFMAAFGQPKPYSNKMLGDLHVVMLADEQWKTAPRNREWAWLTPGQLTWFDQVLKERRDKFTVVCLHQPIQDTVNWSWGGNDFGGCGQAAELRAILKRNPQVKLWLSGHTHIQLDAPGQVAKQSGVTFACLGSTFYQFVSKSAPGYQGGWPGPDGYEKDLSASQSRMLDVWPDRVVLRTRDHVKETWLDQLDVTISRT
jgi:3',5'-cyclic AMP phosphodiesterase CpdA